MSRTNIFDTEVEPYVANGTERVDFLELREKDQKSSMFVQSGPSLSPPVLNPPQSVFGFYYGAVYSPSNDRLYFTPGLAYWNFPGNTQWQYLDCTTSKVVTYSGTYGDVAYLGGAYDQVNDRIYFSPTGPIATKSLTYLDCKKSQTVQYSTIPVDMVDFPYAGATYSPTQHRIYFAPHGQSNQATWHYIDCSTGTIVSYSSPGISTPNAYIGAVYSPVQDRIYFIPADIASQQNWHYIDCATGNVISYPADNMAEWNNILPAGLLADQVQSMALLGNTLVVNLWTDTSSVFQSWNGSSWNIVSSPLTANYFANSQTSYNNLLYYSVFDGLGSDAASIFTYDGTTWTNVTPSWDSNNFFVLSHSINNGHLYVGTQNETVGAQLWKNNLGSWSQVPTPWGVSTTEINAMASFNGLLYIAVTNSGVPRLYTYDEVGSVTLVSSPWAATASTVTNLYTYANSLYAVVKSSSGLVVWTLSNGNWRTYTPNSSAWSAPGAYVISQVQFRNYSYVAVSSPLNGTQIWRDNGFLWEKVVSLSYDFASMLSVQNGTLGNFILTGQDISGGSMLMQNQPQPSYPYATSYLTGVYSPMQNRIYLAPNAAVVDSSWQYIDCNTGTVLTYEHGLSSPSPCSFGAYSAIENKIYFGSFIDQNPVTSINYVDCTTGVWSTVSSSALGECNMGVYYSPSCETTFFVPFMVGTGTGINAEPIVSFKVLSSNTLSPITASNPSYGVG